MVYNQLWPQPFSYWFTNLSDISQLCVCLATSLACAHKTEEGYRLLQGRALTMRVHHHWLKLISFNSSSSRQNDIRLDITNHCHAIIPKKPVWILLTTHQGTRTWWSPSGFFCTHQGKQQWELQPAHTAKTVATWANATGHGGAGPFRLCYHPLTTHQEIHGTLAAYSCMHVCTHTSAC